MGRKKIQITRIMDERNRQVKSLGGWGGWMSTRVGRRGVGGQNALHPTWPSMVKVFWESRVTYGPGARLYAGISLVFFFLLKYR